MVCWWDFSEDEWACGDLLIAAFPEATSRWTAEEKPYFDGFDWTDHAFEKLEKIFISLQQNLSALFFDIATQALGGFGLENDLIFLRKKGNGDHWKRERKPLQFTISRGTIPKTWIWKRALLDRRRQRMPHLVKKGFLTTCLTTDSFGTHGNSGVKRCGEYAETSRNYRKWPEMYRKNLVQPFGTFMQQKRVNCKKIIFWKKRDSLDKDCTKIATIYRRYLFWPHTII